MSSLSYLVSIFGICGIDSMKKLKKRKLKHLLKYGYRLEDFYNYDLGFIRITKSVLKGYKKLGAYPGRFETVEDWHKILDRMLFLLDQMNEETCTYTGEDKADYMCKCKNKFFKLFSEYFYNMWV